MFDSVGRDLDEEATKRQAQSALIALLLVVFVAGSVVGAGMWVVRETELGQILEEEIVELALGEEEPDMEAAPPPPPPPPPPPASSSAEEEEEEEEEPTDEVEPEEMVEEVEELKDEVKDEIKSVDKPKGEKGGVEGGEEGGVVGGVVGGVEDGVVGDQLGGGPKYFHHSQLEVKKRFQPQYPTAARGFNLGKQRCKATIEIDENGVPTNVKVESCPKVFHSTVVEAGLKWRWWPKREGREKIATKTMLIFEFIEQ